MSGPSEWVHPIGPDIPVYFAGLPNECFQGITRTKREGKTPLQGLLYGGVIYQTTPKLVEAPIDLLPDRFELTLTSAGAEEAWSRIEGAVALSGIEPLVGLMPWPIEDRWVIPATAKTEWIMSRSFPFASMLPYNAGDLRTVPKCFIDPAPGETDARVNLTLVTSGLGAGEFLVDTAADGLSIETVDLSGTYAGRILTLRYFPKRLLVPDHFDADMPDYNGLDATLEVSEVIPVREYET